MNDNLPGASPVDCRARPLIGCDELREWLIAQGFLLAEDNLTRDNECNWYAFRRSALSARECERNDGKPMKILVRPFKYQHSSTMHSEWQSDEVEVIGEVSGTWFKLSAYGLKHDELRARLGDIESSLIAAWNALRPNVAANRHAEGVSGSAAG